MSLPPRNAPGPEPLKPPMGLLGAGFLILLMIAGILWWANGSEWSAQAQCEDQGGRWIDAGCEAVEGA